VITLSRQSYKVTHIELSYDEREFYCRFPDCLLQSVILAEKVEGLKMKHAELTMNATGVKKKIDHTKLQQQ
jgi:hypothetical protein